MKKTIIILLLCFYATFVYACWGCCNNGRRDTAIDRLKYLHYSYPSTFQPKYKKHMELRQKEIGILLEIIKTIEREEGFNDKEQNAPPLIFNFDGTITDKYKWTEEK